MRTPSLLVALLVAVGSGCGLTITPLTQGPAKTTTSQTAKPSPSVRPSTAPSTTPSASPSASAAPVSDCEKDFIAFNVNKDTFIDYSEYEAGKFAKVRFVKAPTPQEEAAMKAGFRKEAEAADANKDGRLTREEFLKTCS